MTSSMKAPQIKCYIDYLGRVNYRQYDCAFTYNDKTYALLDELYQLLPQIKPYEKHGNKVWSLWLRAERGSIEDYGDYKDLFEEGAVESYEEFEQNWKEEFPDEIEWLYFQASYDADIDYRAIFLRHRFVIEQDPRKERGLENDISEFVQWLLDAVKAASAALEAGIYNAFVQTELPPQHRIGTVLRKYEWEVAPQQRDNIIGNMTEDDLNYFLQNAQSALADSTPRIPQMNANDFYRYCAMGYRACEYDGTDKPPKEQYYRYADGRDEGLGEISPDDPEAFSNWFHDRRRFGGHPWEVCRGGNSTHVDLFVGCDEKGWYLKVAGSAWTRCAEAQQFFVALHRTGIPVCICQADLLKERILGEEKIGIVPDGVSPVYCGDYFPDEKIIDFMHLPCELEDREKLLKHCVWQPVDPVELEGFEGKHQ